MSEDISGAIRELTAEFRLLVDALGIRSSTINSEKMLSVSEVAKILGVSEKTIRRLIGAEKIGYVKVGSRVLMPASAVDDLRNPK